MESATTGKAGREECEDGIAVSGGLVAVVDGSTSKTSNRISPGMTNGKLCMELVREYVGLAPADIDVEGFCLGVTAHVRRACIGLGADMGLLARSPRERPTASAVVYSDLRREAWLIGDCQCLADGVLYDNPKPQEAILAEKRARVLRGLLAGGLTVEGVRESDPGRAAILEGIIIGSGYQNVAFPVIDGFPIPVGKVRVVRLGDGCREVVLSSDGYPFLMPTLAETEAALGELLEEDPLLIGRFKATKAVMRGNASFDDRAYIRLSV